MSHPSLIEWQKIQRGIRATWANMMGAIIALIIGIMLGIVYKQEDIMEDCKYSGSFRVHAQAYNCQRKI
jgi:hypothetical protein